MKTLLACVLLAGLVHVMPTPALASPSSPLVGRWSVDVSRLPMPQEARPRSVTITFDDAGDGKWRTQVDIVDAAGATSHAAGTSTLDGKVTAVTGSSEADTAAFRMPAPNVLIMALAKGGVPASTRIYTVARDGKSLVETAVYYGDDGLPIMRTHYFTRLK